MTGRDFNDRFRSKPPSYEKLKPTARATSSSGYTPRDTSYIITPEDAEKKAVSNLSDAQKLLTNYGDLLTPSEKADLQMVVTGEGRPQEMGLKEGALVALGRMGETFDRPFQVLRHMANATIDADVSFTVTDLADIMSGNDEAIIARYGEENVGVHGDSSGSQMLKNMGWDEETSTGGKFGRFVAAMGIEVVLDPLTWFTGGFSGLGKKAALASMEKTTSLLTKEVVEKIGREAGTELLSMAPEQAVKKLDDIVAAGGDKLSRTIGKDGSDVLRKELASGDLQKRVAGMGLDELDDAARSKKLQEILLDEIDGSFGVNRSTGVAGKEGMTEFGWDRLTWGIDPKTKKLSKMASPYNLVVAGPGGEGYSWYGKMLNELADNIANKTFHNPKKYSIWDDYLDAATKGRADIWTTGGVTFGFGKWQSQVPGLTKASRGTWTRASRPLLALTRKGPAYKRWTKVREQWSREGIEMVMAARGADNAAGAASYADFSWMRSSQVMGANQTGLIASSFRAMEMADDFNRGVKDIVKGLPRKEREAASEQLAAAVGAAMTTNAKHLDDTGFSDALKAAISEEQSAGLLEKSVGFTNLINETFARAATIMPELKIVEGQMQAYVPMMVRGEPSEIIGEMLFGGDFPLDFSRMSGEDVGKVTSRLTKLGREKGWLQPGEKFELDDFYHLAELAPQSKAAEAASESLGEKAILSSRRFTAGGHIVGPPEDGGVAVSQGLRKAFEDQSYYSRHLMSLLKAIDDEYGMGYAKTLGEFTDVLETNPVIRTQTYIGQMQEAIIERIGFAAAEKISRARRAEFVYDAGAIVALGADTPDKAGAYRRLSEAVLRMKELDEVLERYETLLGDPVKVRIGTKEYFFPPHLSEDRDFMAIVADISSQMDAADEAFVRDPGMVAKAVKKAMDRSPKMSEEEAILHVAMKAAKKVEKLQKKLGKVVQRRIDQQFSELEELVSRHSDELHPDLEDSLKREYQRAYTDAQEQFSLMKDDYIEKAVGVRPKAEPINIDGGQFEEIVEAALESGDAEVLEGLAELRRAYAEDLPEYHPARLQADAEAALYDEAAHIQRIINGELPPPKASPVKEIWSGLQNGVDRQAIEAALRENMRTGGWAPKMFQASEGANVPEIVALASQAGIREIREDAIPGVTLTAKQLEGYSARTIANIMGTDATVVVYAEAGRSGSHEAGSGTAKTIGYAVNGPQGVFGLGFDVNYTHVQFLDDFEEIPGVPGMWRARGRTHKPIIVVTYQPTADAHLIGRMSEHEAGELLNRQRAALQEFYRDHSVEKLNIAGSRFRKENKTRVLKSDYRYGREFTYVADPNTGGYSPAVNVHISGGNLENPIEIGIDMPAPVAQRFMNETVKPMLALQGLEEAATWAEKKAFLVRRLAEVQAGAEVTPTVRMPVKSKAEMFSTPIPVYPTIQAGKQTLANMRSASIEALSIQKLIGLVDHLELTSSDKWFSAARRPKMKPGRRRRMSVEEVLTAARIQAADEWQSDLMDNVPVTLETAGKGQFDPAETVKANATVASQEADFIFEKTAKGERKRVPIVKLRKRAQASIKTMNDKKRGIHEAKMKEAGLSPGDEGYTEYHDVKLNQSGLRAQAEQVVKEAKEAKAAGADVKVPRVHEVEAKLLHRRVRENVDSNASVVTLDEQLQLSSHPYNSDIVTRPTREVVYVDDRAAARIYGLYQKYKSEIGDAGKIVDVGDATVEEILINPYVISDMYTALRSASERIAIALDSSPLPPVSATMPDMGLQSMKPHRMLTSKSERTPGIAMDIGDIPPNPFTVMEIEWNPELYADELRDLAKSQGWSDSHTAPFGSVIPEYGMEGVPSQGLYARLEANPITAKKMREIADRSDRHAEILARRKIGEEFADEFFDVSREGNETVHRWRTAEGEQGRVVTPGEMERIKALAQNNAMKYRDILEHAAMQRGTIQAADRWLVGKFGVDAGDLAAARRMLLGGEEGASPLGIEDYEKILRDWLSQNHPDLFRKHQSDMAAGYDKGLGQWVMDEDENLYDWFQQDLRLRTNKEEGIFAFDDPDERISAFIADMDKRRPADADADWESHEWQRFEAAEASRAETRAGKQRLAGGAEVDSSEHFAQAPTERTGPWQKWIHEAWEAVMRHEGADRREADQLLDFYNTQFFDDPEMTDLRLVSPAEQGPAQQRLDNRVHTRNPASEGPGLDDEVSDQVYAEMVGLDDARVDGTPGAKEAFAREHLGFSGRDAVYAAEESHGRNLGAQSRIFGSEIKRRNLFFSADGQVNLPAMREVRKFEASTPDYVPPTIGVESSRQPARSVIEMGDPGGPTFAKGKAKPLLEIPVTQPEALAKTAQRLHSRQSQRTQSLLSDAPRKVQEGPFGPSRAKRIADEYPGVGPVRRDEARYAAAEAQDVAQRELDEEISFSQDLNQQREIGPDTYYKKVERLTDIEDLDPETGVPRHQITGQETRDNFLRDEVVEGATGGKDKNVGIGEITDNIVRWAADESDVPIDDLKRNLYRLAGQKNSRIMLQPFEGPMGKMVTGPVIDKGFELGIDVHAAVRGWHRFKESGDISLLSMNEWRYMALAQIADEGKIELGEVSIDRLHRLNQRMVDEATGIVEDLQVRREDQMVMEGMRDAAPDKIHQAATFVIGEGKVTKKAVRENLKVSDREAERILDELAEAGIVSKKTSGGRRTLVGGEAELLAMNKGETTVKPGTVALTQEERSLVGLITGKDSVESMTSNEIEIMLLNRSKRLAEATEEWQKLRKRHSPERAERVAGATGQPIVESMPNGSIVSGGGVTFRQLKGNIWDNLEHADAIVVTTNGYIGKASGLATMGAGIAKEVADRFPEIQRELTRHLTTRGNVVGSIGNIVLDGRKIEIISMPVKPVWGRVEDKLPHIKPRGDRVAGFGVYAQPEIIDRSVVELQQAVEVMGLNHVMMPRPGAGAGGLPVDDVLNNLNGVLDNRFIVADGRTVWNPATPRVEQGVIRGEGVAAPTPSAAVPSPELEKIDADLVRLKKQMDAAGADSKQKTQALNDILENKAPDGAAPKRLAATGGGKELEFTAVTLVDAGGTVEDFHAGQNRYFEYLARNNELSKELTTEVNAFLEAGTYNYTQASKDFDSLIAGSVPAEFFDELVPTPKKGGVDPRLGPAKKAADAAGDEINRLHAIRDKMYAERKKLARTAEADIANKADVVPEPVQIAEDAVQDVPGVQVDPTAAGQGKVDEALTTKTALENQVRRLEKIRDRVVTETGKKPAVGGFHPSIAGPSPLTEQLGQNIQGYTFKHPNNIKDMPFDESQILYVGRSTSKKSFIPGYHEGAFSNRHIIVHDPKALSDFNRRWAGKKHPLFNKKYVAKASDGEATWGTEFRSGYNSVSNPDEAAALYHEDLWAWIEANPEEAKRVAAWIATNKPNMYVIRGTKATTDTSDVNVIAEAFAHVHSGRTTNPGNRWAAILEGRVTDEAHRLRESVDALAGDLAREAKAKYGTVTDQVDQVLKDVADTELVNDTEVHKLLEDLLKTADKGDARVVASWAAKSRQLEKFLKLVYGEEVRVAAYLDNVGKPVIQVMKPGSEVGGVEKLSEKGLDDVLRRMSLPESDPDFISVTEATRRMGGELVQLHAAKQKVEEAARIYEHALKDTSLPQNVRPTPEKVAAAQVAVAEYDNLMHAIWKAVKNQDPDELKEMVWHEVDGEWVPTDGYKRIMDDLELLNPDLAHQVQDFITLGLESKLPMSSKRWADRVHEAMGTIPNMSTENQSRVASDYIERILWATTNATSPQMLRSELQRVRFEINDFLYNAYVALDAAAEYDEPTKRLVDTLHGPLERMSGRFQTKGPTRVLAGEDAGMGNIVESWASIGAWLDDIAVDSRMGRVLEYADAGGKGQYSRETMVNLDSLRRDVKEILSNPAVMQPKLAGPAVPAIEVGLSGPFASKYVIDYSLGKELAQAVAMSKQMTKDANMRHLLKATHSVWQWWKRAATIARPSFHIRNFIGGMYNNMLIGVNPATYFSLGPDVMKYQYRMNTFKHALDTSIEPEEAFYNHVLTHISPKHRSLFYNVWKQGVLETSFSKGDLGHMPGRSWVNPTAANWIPYQAGGAAMEGVEGLLRVAAFNKYFDPNVPYITGQYAKEMVNTVHFDYVNLTPMEENIKKFVPFFVWSRRNIPLQIRMLLQSPRWAMTVNKAKKLWNEEFDDDPQLGAEGFATPWGRENDLGWSKLIWSPDLPMMDIYDMPLFQGRQLGATPFGEDARDLQKWAFYGLELLGPAATIPHDLLAEDDRTTNAPAGINELLALSGGLLGQATPSASKDYKLPWYINSFIDTSVPFYHDYRSAIGMEANNPYRAAREGMLPGEQQAMTYPGANIGAGWMRTFGRGAGFGYTGPIDDFFSNRELERMIDEIRASIRERMPEAEFMQVAELEAAQSA